MRVDFRMTRYTNELDLIDILTPPTKLVKQCNFLKLSLSQRKCKKNKCDTSFKHNLSDFDNHFTTNDTTLPEMYSQPQSSKLTFEKDTGIKNDTNEIFPTICPKISVKPLSELLYTDSNSRTTDEKLEVNESHNDTDNIKEFKAEKVKKLQNCKEISNEIIILSSDDENTTQTKSKINTTVRKRRKNQSREKNSKSKSDEIPLKTPKVEIEKIAIERRLTKSTNLKTFPAKYLPASQKKIDSYFNKLPNKNDAVKYFDTFDQTKPQTDDITKQEIIDYAQIAKDSIDRMMNSNPEMQGLTLIDLTDNDDYEKCENLKNDCDTFVKDNQSNQKEEQHELQQSSTQKSNKSSKSTNSSERSLVSDFYLVKKNHKSKSKRTKKMTQEISIDNNVPLIETNFITDINIRNGSKVTECVEEKLNELEIKKNVNGRNSLSTNTNSLEFAYKSMTPSEKTESVDYAPLSLPPLFRRSKRILTDISHETSSSLTKSIEKTKKLKTGIKTQKYEEENCEIVDKQSEKKSNKNAQSNVDVANKCEINKRKITKSKVRKKLNFKSNSNLNDNNCDNHLSSSTKDSGLNSEIYTDENKTFVERNNVVIVEDSPPSKKSKQSKRKSINKKDSVMITVNNNKNLMESPSTPLSNGQYTKMNKGKTTASKITRKEKSTVKCPDYKIIKGTTFAVDAFRFGYIEGITHYFLTHFHADHYIGLKKSFEMPLYLSEISAKLVKTMIGVDQKYLNVINLNETIQINNIEITAIDANHCPGAIMIHFKLPSGKCILHTGDFRASPYMESEPIFWNHSLHTIYLDTTYLSNKYAFKPQNDSIDDAVRCVDEFREKHIGEKILIVCGSYVIGKEKVWMAIAEKFNLTVWMEGNRKKTIKAINDSNMLQYLNDNPYTAGIHVLTMNKLTNDYLWQYLNQFSDHFNILLAIRPSGWEKNSKPQFRGKVNIVGIEYSEHSSYDELRRFIRFLQPLEIISTVPYSSNNLTKTTKIPNSWFQNDVKNRQISYQSSITNYGKLTTSNNKKINNKINSIPSCSKTNSYEFNNGVINELDETDGLVLDATKSNLSNTNSPQSLLKTPKKINQYNSPQKSIRTATDTTDWMS